MGKIIGGLLAAIFIYGFFSAGGIGGGVMATFIAAFAYLTLKTNKKHNLTAPMNDSNSSDLFVDSLDRTDYITDPTYSFMSCNIHNSDDN